MGADEQWDWDAGVWWRAREHGLSEKENEKESTGSVNKSTVSVSMCVTCRVSGSGLRSESQSQSQSQAKATVIFTVKGTGQAWVGDLSGAVRLLSHYVVLWSVGSWIVDTLCMDIRVFFERWTETYV